MSSADTHCHEASERPRSKKLSPIRQKRILPSDTVPPRSEFAAEYRVLFFRHKPVAIIYPICVNKYEYECNCTHYLLHVARHAGCAALPPRAADAAQRSTTRHTGQGHDCARTTTSRCIRPGAGQSSKSG
eukprot:6194020-Pleurochrysis_carterae.AAC.4